MSRTSRGEVAEPGLSDQTRLMRKLLLAGADEQVREAGVASPFRYFNSSPMVNPQTARGDLMLWIAVG